MRPLLLLPLLVLAAAPLSGQVRVEGIVRDDADGSPLAGVRIEVLDALDHRIRTLVADSAGNFLLPLRRLGVYRLRLSHPGYPRTTAEVRTEAFPYLNVEMRLSSERPLAVPMAVLTRSQALPPPALDGYHARLRSGEGRFFTRETVDRLRPAYLSELIATAPGIEVERAEEEDRVLHARLPAGRCILPVYVDGELVNGRGGDGALGPAPLDAMVLAPDVQGIEVYADPERVPAAFREAGGGCGAAAVWTRRAR